MKRNETKEKQFKHGASRRGRLICWGQSEGWCFRFYSWVGQTFGKELFNLPLAGLASGCQFSVAVPPATGESSEHLHQTLAF